MVMLVGIRRIVEVRESRIGESPYSCFPSRFRYSSKRGPLLILQSGWPYLWNLTLELELVMFRGLVRQGGESAAACACERCGPVVRCGCHAPSCSPEPFQRKGPKARRDELPTARKGFGLIPVSLVRLLSRWL